MIEFMTTEITVPVHLIVSVVLGAVALIISAYAPGRIDALQKKS